MILHLKLLTWSRRRQTISTNHPFYYQYEPVNGAFKGRGRAYMTLLACPVDGASLTLGQGVVRCSADAAHVYPFEDAILRLMSPDQQVALNAQSAAHEAECAAAQQASPDEAAFKALPQSGLSGYPDDYWARQATSTALLWRFLEMIRLKSGGLPIGPMGEAAVIGAGLGWLAYGLDVAGYTTIALDWRAGPRYGLGAYPIARYLRVQADTVTPPLARGAFDLLIYQDGLAAVDDDTAQQAALGHGLRTLRPGGHIVVMDAPATGYSADSARPPLEAAGLALVEPPRRQGWRGHLSGIGERLTGSDAPPLPVVVGQKPGS